MCENKSHGLDEESMNKFAYICLAFDASSGLKTGIKMKIMNLFLLSIRRFSILFCGAEGEGYDWPKAKGFIGPSHRTLF